MFMLFNGYYVDLHNDTEEIDHGKTTIYRNIF